MGKAVRRPVGDADLEDAYRRHKGGLKAITRRAGTEDEGDLAQDACLKLVETARIQPVRAPGHLLFRIARNLVIDRLRGRARAGRLFEAQGGFDAACPAPDPERALLASERLRLALAVIDAMPERRREAFLLHRIENLSYPRIAGRMGVSVKAVEKHISLAMLQLMRGMQSGDTGR